LEIFAAAAAGWRVISVNKKTKRFLKSAAVYLRIVLGAAIYAAGLVWLYRPAGMISGGVTGISMVINMVTKLPTGTLIIIFNIPIFIVTLKLFGFKFMLSSIIGMLAASLLIDLFSTLAKTPITTDPLLSAIFGGVVTGFGMGIVYGADATSGGVDLIATVIKQKRPYIRFGNFILALDAVVVLGYALFFKRYNNAMYTVIAVFISSRVVDLVLYGMSQSKLCHIISEHSDEIKTEIVKSLHRGVTLLQGKGAYSGQDKQILLCVVKRQQIVEIRKIIKSIDQAAFVIVTDTRDVFGQGFANLMSDKKIGN
jgi:uncharacterized membrane-anchored protein YitT (DUF2179 family)